MLLKAIRLDKYPGWNVEILVKVADLMNGNGLDTLLFHCVLLHPKIVWFHLP